MFAAALVCVWLYKLLSADDQATSEGAEERGVLLPVLVERKATLNSFPVFFFFLKSQV